MAGEVFWFVEHNLAVPLCIPVRQHVDVLQNEYLGI